MGSSGYKRWLYTRRGIVKTFVIHSKKDGKLQHAIIKADEVCRVTAFEARVDGETVLRIGGPTIVAVSEMPDEAAAVRRIRQWKRAPATWAAIAASTGRMLHEI